MRPKIKGDRMTQAELCILDELERVAENSFIEATKDCLPGYFKCGCGRIEHINNAQPASSRPYAAMVCIKCFKEVFGENIY